MKDEKTYKGVTLGVKEGEVMKDLIYRHKFFIRDQVVNFQGSCTVSPKAAKVCILLYHFEGEYIIV